jgi:transcription elongation GreA/GreB family factor
MTFSDRDQNLIEFGRFTIYQSLKEMISEGDDINNIDYDEMIKETLANINDTELLSVIDKVLDMPDDIAVKDWRDGLE